MRIALYRRRRGQALTELALLMPFLALLLVGLIEFGFLLYAHIQVSSAAREGARAASLYRSMRYSTTADVQSNNFSTESCATLNSVKVEGWTIEQTVEQAIVRFSDDAKGCPTTSGTILYSALGQLAPARSTATPPTPFTACPVGDADGWSTGLTPAFPYATTTSMPNPGDQATLTLCYPYRLILLSDLLPFIGEPVWINKSVNFQFQP
jgi:Flp pilus assembly protein TadG